jgi:putative glutamine amidotransferase
MKTPVIGITLDSEDPGTYSKYPWYALRENYAGAVSHAGGLPIVLPHEPSLVDQYLEQIDGLVVTGGDFDVDPAMFGAAECHETVKTKSNRTQFERAIIDGAIAADMPVLGICGGQQLLHVVLGGTLIQHIPDEIENPLAHEQPNPRHEVGHSVTIKEGTLLYDIIGETEIEVNSAHHQAAKEAAPSVKINAVAPDGVIEGIETEHHRFCLGVQWHPEFLITPSDERIFAAFIDASRSS